WLIAMLLMVWPATIVLGATMLVLGRRMPKRSVLVVVLGSVGLAACFFTSRSDFETSLQMVVSALAAILVTAFVNALALRVIGYRLARPHSQPAESMPHEPLVS